MSEKIRIIGIGTEVDPKTLFTIGRIGISLSIMCFAFLLLSGKISREEDLQSYFNFWQSLAPRSYGGPKITSHEDELAAFAKESFFEFQRFMNILTMILGSGMMLADNRYGSLYCLVSIAYYALVHTNPILTHPQYPQAEQQTWLMLMNFIAIIGGLLIAYTRGHTKTIIPQESDGRARKKIQ